jgi:hypothetical protein
MSSRNKLLIRPVFLAALLCGAASCRPPAAAVAPAPAPADIESAQWLEGVLGEISGERALRLAGEFAGLGPKVAGTPEAEAAAGWLAARFADAGAVADMEVFSDAAPAGETVFRNVVARVPAASGGGGAEGLLLFAAHYDTKSGIPGFVGANDSASGVAVLLELARAFAAHPLPGTEVRLACLDGEECAVQYGPRDGLHGSRRWAADLEAAGELPRVRAFFLLDMVGDADFTPTLPRNCTPALLSRAFEAARAEGVRGRVSLSPGPVLDDHVPFFERGVPSLDLIDFEYGSAPGLNDYWHTAEDTVDKLSADSLALAARLALRIACGQR